MTLHSLAAALHKGVWEINQMPTSEYLDWLLYYKELERQREAESGNLLAMDEDEMFERLTG